MWKQVNDLNSVKKLYYVVTPEPNRDETLLTRFPNQYRAFCYYETNVEMPLAFGVIGILPKNKAFMINLFAIDFSIRNMGYVRLLFKRFIQQMPMLWPDLEQCKNSWLLETHIHNATIWCKIMEMKPVDTELKPMHLHNEVKLLEHNVPNVVNAYKEWHEFQMKWYNTNGFTKKAKL